MTIEYQTSDHGCGKFSAQFFRDGVLLEDRAVVKEIDGWRVIGNSKYDRPQHASVDAAAKHYATLLSAEMQTSDDGEPDFAAQFEAIQAKAQGALDGSGSHPWSEEYLRVLIGEIRDLAQEGIEMCEKVS